jgi:hypothetical protein
MHGAATLTGTGRLDVLIPHPGGANSATLNCMIS